MNRRWTRLATVITGASSGLGAEFARQLATRKCPLLLIARRGDRLDAFKPELEQLGAPRVETVVADLNDPDETDRIANEIKTREFPIAGLINNAGLGYYGLDRDAPRERRRSIVQVNINALIDLTHTLLPLLEKQSRGLILNVSSIAGFVPLPDIATYAASKSFVSSWSFSLEKELRDGPTNVMVHTLCPGPTQSEFMVVAANDAQAERPGRMSAESCIRQCLEAVDQGQAMCIPGLKNRISTILPRLLPIRMQTWIARKMTNRPPAKFD